MVTVASQESLSTGSAASTNKAAMSMVTFLFFTWVADTLLLAGKGDWNG